MSGTTPKLGITTWDGTDAVNRTSFNDNWNKIDEMAQKNIIKASAAPANPVADDLWIDTSQTPNLMKRYDGAQWDTVGSMVGSATGSAPGTVELPPSAGTPGTPVVPYRAARVQEYELTDTALDTILSYTPAATGNFSINIYCRVVTAATNVLIDVTYTDASGAETYTVVNQSLSPGEYMFPAPFFNALANDLIAVKAQAGTANQVYISASLMGE